MNKYEENINSKFREFIDYLNIEGNEIPTPKSEVYFKDNTNMGHFLSNHELKIKNWLNDENRILYPVAYRKLYCRINSRRAKRITEFQDLRDLLLHSNKSYTKLK